MEKSKFSQILDIAKFGVGYRKGEGGNCDGIGEAYIRGTLDGTAHIIACCLVQWFNLNDGVATCDVLDALNLEEFPDDKELRQNLEELFSRLNLECYIFD